MGVPRKFKYWLINNKNHEIHHCLKLYHFRCSQQTSSRIFRVSSSLISALSNWFEQKLPTLFTIISWNGNNNISTIYFSVYSGNFIHWVPISHWLCRNSRHPLLHSHCLIRHDPIQRRKKWMLRLITMEWNPFSTYIPQFDTRQGCLYTEWTNLNKSSFNGLLTKRINE